MDLNARIIVTVPVGVQIVALTQTACMDDTARTAAQLHVYNGSSKVAIYPVYNFTDSTLGFMVDNTINAAEGNYTFEVVTGTCVLQTGALVVTRTNAGLRDVPTNHQCGVCP